MATSLSLWRQITIYQHTFDILHKNQLGADLTLPSPNTKLENFT